MTFPTNPGSFPDLSKMKNSDNQALAETLRAGFSLAVDAPRRVVLERPTVGETGDERLWAAIKSRSRLMGFDVYQQFVDGILCGTSHPNPPARIIDLQESLRQLGVFGTDAYQLLRTATELFLMTQCTTLSSRPSFVPASDGRTEAERKAEEDAVALALRTDYLTALERDSTGAAVTFGLPYSKLVINNLAGLPLKGPLSFGNDCYGILRSRASGPCLLELIWSYWHEQGMLVQTMNAVTLRFQNIRRHVGHDPLANLELDSLRPLSNVVWGYLQDEQSRLSIVRRAYEYDHEYGLRLEGKAIPELNPADSRQRFIPAFHDLLYRAWTFLKEDAIRTIDADAFPVLNSLRELHFVLAEGAHNQFGDLPWQARVEMLIQMWLLARPEMGEFLRGRVAMPYPEPWMDRIDTMKQLQGWTDVSVLHFNDLATFGEQLVLSARYGDWSRTNDALRAANWARDWRDAINRYIHAYRTVTGVDLTMDTVGTVPAALRDAQPRILVRATVATSASAALGDGAASASPSAALKAGLPDGTSNGVAARLPRSLTR
jgi:hypothetical protein